MNVHIPRSHDSCCTVTLAANLKHYFLKIGDHTVLASTKNDYFFDKHTSPICKLNNRSVVKNNWIHKHGTSFKTSSPFCVDAINVWSHLANNWKKKEGKERLTVKSLDVFFYLFHTKNIHDNKETECFIWLKRCLLYLLDVFWTLLPRNILETQSKVYAKRLHHRSSSGF